MEHASVRLASRCGGRRSIRPYHCARSLKPCTMMRSNRPRTAATPRESHASHTPRARRKPAFA
eukprot:10202289-Lingulodinium_polyedra.AAC.1